MLQSRFGGVVRRIRLAARTHNSPSWPRSRPRSRWSAPRPNGYVHGSSDPVARIFAERPAIIVSILLAFGIQAWWDDRLDRREERILLAGLLIDLRADSTNCAEAVERQERASLPRTCSLTWLVIRAPTKRVPQPRTNPEVVVRGVGGGRVRLAAITLQRDQVGRATERRSRQVA